MITIVRLFDPWEGGASLLRAAGEASGRVPGSFLLDVYPGRGGSTGGGRQAVGEERFVGEQLVDGGAVMYIPFPYKLRQQVSPATGLREMYVRRIADLLVERLTGVERPVVHIAGRYWTELARRLKSELDAMIVYEFDGGGAGGDGEMMEIAHRVLCSNEVSKGLAMERYGVEQNKIVVLYHPTPVGTEKEEARVMARALARAAFGFDEAETIILFDKKLAATDYHPRRLLGVCGDRADDWHLWVVNEQDATAYREVFHSRHWRRMHFTDGLMKGDEKDLYAAADLMILPPPTESNFQDVLALAGMRAAFIADGAIEDNPWYQELLRQKVILASEPDVFSRNHLRKELFRLYRQLSPAEALTC